MRNPLSLEPNSLKVQIPNNHILTQNQYYNYYYPNTKYPIIGYLDPLGLLFVKPVGNPDRLHDSQDTALAPGTGNIQSFGSCGTYSVDMVEEEIYMGIVPNIKLNPVLLLGTVF